MTVHARAILLCSLLGACAPVDTANDLAGDTSASSGETPSTEDGDATSDGMSDASTSEHGSSSTSASESDATGSSGPGSDTDESASTGGSGDTSSTTSTTGSSTNASTTSDDASTTDGSTTSDGGSEESGGESTGDTGDDNVCESTIVRTHVGQVDTFYNGDRFATLDEADNLVLWDAASLAVLFEANDASRVELSGGTLFYVSAEDDSAHTVDAATGTSLGEVDPRSYCGLARDGSYAWSADNSELVVYELDGSLRWSVADDFDGLDLLALGDQLHVYAPMQSASEVLRVGADDGGLDSEPFTGAFGGWFDDVPRYWTKQGMAYRVYDVDNAMLFLEIGYPSYGFGRWLGFEGWSVLDVLDPDTVVPFPGAGGGYDRYGAGIMTRAMDGSIAITRLDTDPIETELVDPSCCTDDPQWSLAFDDGAWVVGGDDGRVVDHLGRSVTSGEILAIAGSISGRIALSSSDGTVQVADVAEDCSFVPSTTFPRTGRDMRMSADGTLLLSIEHWQEGLTSARDGVRFYDPVTGTLLESTQVGLTSESLLALRVSDDASMWARVSGNGMYHNYTGYLPLAGGTFMSGNGDVPTSFAPDGSHIVTSDGLIPAWQTWSDSTTYIYDPDDLVAVVEGVCHGFVDADRVLVSRYEDCGSYCVSLTGSDVVGMDGAVAQVTSLPDIRDVIRVADGEVIGVDAVTGDAAIYDVYAGTVLWAAPAGAQVQPGGPDHVLVSTGARADLVRWR